MTNIFLESLKQTERIIIHDTNRLEETILADAYTTRCTHKQVPTYIFSKTHTGTNAIEFDQYEHTIPIPIYRLKMGILGDFSLFFI